MEQILPASLKPCFYRFGSHAKVYRGWASEQVRGGLLVLDIFAIEKDAAKLAESYRGVDARLHDRLSRLDPTSESVVLVPEARPALLVAEKLRFTRTLDYSPHGEIVEGTTAFCLERDAETGDVDIFLEGFHELILNNTIPLSPKHLDEEWLDSIETHWEGVMAAPAILKVSR